MGDIADDMFDIAIQQMAEYDFYFRYSDRELKELAESCISQPGYTGDVFTPVVKDILKRDQFSKKQRKILIGHLYYHDEDLKED